MSSLARIFEYSNFENVESKTALKTSAKLGGQYSFLTFVTWTYRLS